MQDEKSKSEKKVEEHSRHHVDKDEGNVAHGVIGGNIEMKEGQHESSPNDDDQSQSEEAK